MTSFPIAAKHCLCIMALLIITSFMQGCAVYKASVDERSVKTIAQDELISATISKKLLEDSTMKVLDIEAPSYNGHVYLIGEYDFAAQKSRAVKIAKSVEGVRNITTYLLPKKKNDLCDSTDNLLIRGKLDKALIADNTIWSTNVDVTVVQCHIILTGVVGSATERNKAIAHAKAVPSARSVTSYLSVGGDR